MPERRIPPPLAAAVAAMLALAAAWTAGFGWYVRTVPTTVADTATVTDAIVVLTGGSERINVGLDLLHRGLSRQLFVSGVARSLDTQGLLRHARQPTEAATCCIVLGHAADSTEGNALETAAWMRRQGFHSLRLVTAAYHMRRSLLEFRFAMPDIAVIAHPVFPEGVRPYRRWLLLASEYSKYLAAWLRHWGETAWRHA